MIQCNGKCSGPHPPQFSYLDDRCITINQCITTDKPEMKIAAVVILYHPDEATPERILSYSTRVNKLIVADNSEDNSRSKNIFQSLPATSSFEYMHDGENQGISKRLNDAAALALQEGFDWLLTMDQDSYFSADTLSRYFHCIESDPHKSHTAMYGASFAGNKDFSDLCTAVEVPHLITSGSMLNLSLFKSIGNFDEALFIDKVDFEYCFRAQVHGYKIIQFSNIFLHHNLGSKTSGRSLKSLQLTTRVLHSPVRMYYIIRNYFYLKSLYPGSFTESFADMKKEILNRLKNNLLYGKHRGKLIRLIRKSYLDFRSGRMGKLLEK